MRNSAKRNMIMLLLLSVVAAVIPVIPFGCDILAGNVPMTLYGRVIDQTGAPVPNAQIDFTAAAAPRFRPPIPLFDAGEIKWEVHATTDQNGDFTLSAGRGSVLYPLRTGELGFRGFRKGVIPGPFNFTRQRGVIPYHPDPKSPVIFVWWNEAYKRILSRTVSCQPARDDGCTVEYLSGAMTNSEGGFENLEIMVHRPAAGAAAPFDWSVDVRALDGGVVETKDRLASQAPPDGYKPSASYVVAAADTHWSRRLVRRFYSRNHGYEIQSMIYAWVELQVTLDETSADPTVKVHYVANFGNSRDLVPGPTKPAAK